MNFRYGNSTGGRGVPRRVQKGYFHEPDMTIRQLIMFALVAGCLGYGFGWSMGELAIRLFVSPSAEVGLEQSVRLIEGADK